MKKKTQKGLPQKIDAGDRVGADGLFVGHAIFHGEPGALQLSFGSDWNELLVRKKDANAILRGSDEAFRLAMAEKIVASGAAMLHFWVKPSEDGDAVNVLDCAPGCENAAEARLFLGPTKGVS